MRNTRSRGDTPLFSPRLLAIAVSCAWASSALTHAATMPIDPNDPLNPVPKYVIPLVIPPEMPKSGTTEPCPVGAVCPATDYNIAVRQFKQQILPGGVWNTVNGRKDNFGATTVWSYGPAADPLPPGGVAPAPAALSSFNYPAFTVEAKAQKRNTVRWINELVATDPLTGKPYPLNDARRTALTHLTPVDRTLHWANPERLACGDPATGTTKLPGATNCRPYVSPTTPDPLLAKSYDGPVPMVVHVHGAEVSPYSDGFPEAWWLPSGIDPKTGTSIANKYATKGDHYDQSPRFRANTYPGSAVFGYENVQPATTLWYHDHTLGMTANNVYAGPAGFWLVRGEYQAPDGTVVQEQPQSGVLPGEIHNPFGRPTNPKILYGSKPGCDPNFDKLCRSRIREIPIALQDRAFNADGTLFYPDTRAYFDGGSVVPYLPSATSDVSPIHQPEFFGNMIVVNGTVWPTFDVVPQRYRLRLLAGADSRTFNLGLYAIAPGTVLPDPMAPQYAFDPLLNPNAYRNYWTDFRATKGVTELPFYQIGAEQGFLPQVVKVMTGTAVALPGNGTEPAAVCTPAQAAIAAVPATATTPAVPAVPAVAPSNPADPGCNRALLMAPAERADVIVDFSAVPPGTKVRMVNTGPDVPFNDGWVAADIASPAGTGQVMEFNVVAPTPLTRPDESSRPADLILSSEPANTAPVMSTRRAALIEEDSKKICVTVGPTGALTVVSQVALPQANPTAFCAGLIDPVSKLPLGAIPFGPTETFVGTLVGGVPQPQRWADPVTQAPVVGNTEIFELYNFTIDAHPMHLHGARIQVVNREKLVTDLVTGAAVIPAATTGVITPSVPTEAGYKDIVIVNPGEVTRVKARFDYAGLYVWHCHIVEHEDNEMMIPVCIKGSTADTACNAAPGGTPWPIVNGGLGFTY